MIRRRKVIIGENKVIDRVGKPVDVLELKEIDGAYKYNKKKKRKRDIIFRVRTLLLLLLILLSLLAFKLGGFLSGVDSDATGESSVVMGTVMGNYFYDNVIVGNTESFKSAARRYFKTKYGINVTVHDVKYSVKGEDILIEGVVKLYGDDKDYKVMYKKEGKYVDASENYGSTYTSKLLSERLTKLLKYTLPSRAELWVSARDLSEQGDIRFSDIEDVISSWDIADIMSYNKANHLIESINISIISGSDSNLSRFGSRLLNIVTTLDSSQDGLPKLYVGFFKGKNSMNYVYTDVKNRYGVSELDFSIDWCKEIPKVDKVRNYMWGAISIEENPIEVLSSYVYEDKTTYSVEGVEEELKIYNSVSDLLSD